MAAIPINLLRAVIGLMCVLFAYFLGRTATRAYLGRGRKSRMYGWLIRTAITAAVITWRRGVDSLALAAYALAALTLAAGVWLELRPPKQPENVSREIFPN